MPYKTLFNSLKRNKNFYICQIMKYILSNKEL